MSKYCGSRAAREADSLIFFLTRNPMRRVYRAARQKLERERNVINPHPFPAHHGGEKSITFITFRRFWLRQSHGFSFVSVSFVLS